MKVINLARMVSRFKTKRLMSKVSGISETQTNRSLALDSKVYENGDVYIKSKVKYPSKLMLAVIELESADLENKGVELYKNEHYEIALKDGKIIEVTEVEK